MNENKKDGALGLGLVGQSVFQRAVSRQDFPWHPNHRTELIDSPIPMKISDHGLSAAVRVFKANKANTRNL